MQEEFRYGQKLEVRGGNYIVEVVGRIPKSTPYVVNMNTTDDRLNVRINGEPFNNLTIKQINGSPLIRTFSLSSVVFMGNHSTI